MYGFYNDAGVVIAFAPEYSIYEKDDRYICVGNALLNRDKYSIFETDDITEIPENPCYYFFDEETDELSYFGPTIQDDSEEGTEPAPDEPEIDTPSEEESPSIDMTEVLKYYAELKCKEINDACHNAIVNGIDVETSYGAEHFSLKEDDQTNITNLGNIAKTTGLNVPYHCDNGDCKIYLASDMIKIANTAIYWITHNTTYCNQLKKYVRSLTNSTDIYNVNYGLTELAGDYLEAYNTCMNAIIAIAK